MSYQSPHERRIAALRIVTIYALFGLSWIYGSDTLLGWLVNDPAVLVRIAVIKGSLFILCTATLLYFLIGQYVQQLATAESAKIESLKNYETIFNTTTEAIFVHDALSGHILDVNDRMLEIYGYTRNEALSVDIENLSEGTPPYSQADAAEYVRKTLLEGPQVFEWHSRKKNGELFWSEVSLRQITIRESDRIIAVVRDISERKWADQALKESNEKIRSLVNCVPGYIAFVNADTLEYEFVNQAFEISFGIPRENIVGSHIRCIIGEANYQFALKYIEEVRTGKAVSYENTFELTSGKRWIKVNYSPIADNSGHVMSIVVHSYDITDLKEHEKEQLKMEKLESLGVLAGGIAHDFNNILTAIMGNISLAQVFIDGTHKSYKALLGAEQASVRAAELARQLLTFARGGEPVKKIVSLSTLVSEAVSLVLRGSNVKASIDIPENVHAIEADEGQISQVLHNIIINATQAMPGGGTLTVAAGNVMLGAVNAMSLPAGPYVCLSFADEGCGIPDDLLSKIFDPYYTTKANGNGLGLASAHSIITKHGGHIGVSSGVEKGANFTIYLPSISASYLDYRAESVTPTSVQRKGRTILVMDDEEMIRELTAAMLAELGYLVTACNDGAEAIENYKVAWKSGTPFFAVLMDLTVPGGMGGKEAAKEVLALDPTACLIVSSGYSNDPIMSDYSAYGFSGAIAKPYRINELAHVLDSVS